MLLCWWQFSNITLVCVSHIKMSTQTGWLFPPFWRTFFSSVSTRKHSSFCPSAASYLPLSVVPFLTQNFKCLIYSGLCPWHSSHYSSSCPDQAGSSSYMLAISISALLGQTFLQTFLKRSYLYFKFHRQCHLPAFKKISFTSNSVVSTAIHPPYCSPKKCKTSLNFFLRLIFYMQFSCK